MQNGKVVTSKILKYTVIFDPDKNGGFVATVPTLPGCVTQGETFEEATQMAQDAISGYLTVLKEEGLSIPTETGESVITKVSVPFPFQVAI